MFGLWLLEFVMIGFGVGGFCRSIEYAWLGAAVDLEAEDKLCVSLVLGVDRGRNELSKEPCCRLLLELEFEAEGRP
jgi:hypothetical protein